MKKHRENKREYLSLFRSLQATVMVSLAAVLFEAAAFAQPCEPQWDNAIGQPGVNWDVRALTVFDDGSGSGPALYAGGRFTTAGGVVVNHIARWDGTEWQPLDNGVGGGTFPQVRALALYNGELIAGGRFAFAGGTQASNIAKWDGTTWHPLGSGIGGESPWVLAIVVHGEELIVGGNFTSAGGVSANNIARWNGSYWQPMGQGVTTPGSSASVRALTVYGDELIAGGFFSTAGGQSANGVARWDGSSWHPLDSGLTHWCCREVNALIVYEDELIAGGHFDTAGGVAANEIAKWNGSSWAPFDTEPGWTVRAFAVLQNKLIVGGSFISVGDMDAAYITQWDGKAWSALGSGLNNPVLAVTAIEQGDGGKPAILAGGEFTTAGGLPANRIAAWSCPDAPCLPPDLNCNGAVGVADLLILLAEWGQCTDCAPGNCPADLTGDCAVGVADLLILLANWG